MSEYDGVIPKSASPSRVVTAWLMSSSGKLKPVEAGRTRRLHRSGSQAPKPPRGDVQSLRPNVVRDRSHLERLVALFEAGVIRVPEVTRFALSEAAAAHRVSQARHFRGKLVLVVR
jgi:NADPH:quinone reductase and related Zn-dependent oxidoreductases